LLTPEVVLPAGAELGEGPVWHQSEQKLVWLDILGHRVHAYDPAADVDVVTQYDEPVAALVPATGGGWIATIGRDVTRVSADGSMSRLATIPAGDRGNDGKCDPFGRYLVGTLTNDHAERACGLYRLQDGELVTVVPDVTLANGLDWSPDGHRLYFVDTVTEQVDVFDYLPDGTVGGRRMFADLREAPGRPDGLTVDAEGGVWIAVIRAGELRRYDADGRLDELVSFPVNKVTSCAFGGDDLRDLYVTSASFAPIGDEPLAGALFRLRPGVAGKPTHLFAG
jgi:sugar lactone lactonase YvrE